MMKRIIGVFLVITVILTVLFAAPVLAAVKDQTLEILPGSPEELKLLVSSSAPYVEAATCRFSDCFRTAIYRFDFPDDTTAAKAVFTLADGFYRISASEDMVNWTTLAGARFKNQAVAGDYEVDLTPYISKNPGKTVFVRCDDPTILSPTGGGLDGTEGTRTQKIVLNFKASSNEMNPVKAFDALTINDWNWISFEDNKTKLNRPQASQIIDMGGFTKHELFGYIVDADGMDIPMVYKFKLPSGTKKAALAFCAQYSGTYHVSADNKSYKKIHEQIADDKANNGLTVKHLTLAIPDDCIAADGTVYVRVQAEYPGHAWTMAMGVVAVDSQFKDASAQSTGTQTASTGKSTTETKNTPAPEKTPAAEKTPEPEKTLEPEPTTTSDSSSSEVNTTTAENTPNEETAAPSENTPEPTASPETEKAEADVKNAEESGSVPVSTENTNVAGEKNNSNNTIIIVVIVAVVLAAGGGAAYYFLVAAKK